MVGMVFSDKVERQTLSTDSILWKVKGNKDIRTFLNFHQSIVGKQQR